jgi:hypothetical protein
MRLCKFIKRLLNSNPVFLSVIGLALSLNPIYGQASQFDQLYSLNLKIKDYSTDNFQNLYLISNDDEVLKFNSNGILEYKYLNKTLGNIGTLDATNPFLTLLYYPDFLKVVFLDKSLNVVSQINLQEIGYFRGSVICISSDANIWFYDELSSTLKKMSTEGKVLFEGEILNLTFGKTLQPTLLLEKNQKIFMGASDGKILIFDTFGKYTNSIEFGKIADFQIIEDNIHFVRDGKWENFHLKSLLFKEMKLPEGFNSVQKVRIENDKVFLMQSGKLTVFRVK